MQPDSVKREELEPAVPQRAQLAAPVSSSVWAGAVRAAEGRPSDASSKVKTEVNELSVASAREALPSTYLPTPPPATTENASTAVDSQARPAPPAPPQATAQSDFVNDQLEGARANVGSSERTGTQAEVEPYRGQVLLEAAVAPRPAQTQTASPIAPLTSANLSRLHNAPAVEQSGEQAKEDDAQSNADSLSSASSSIAERAPVASSSQPQDVGMWTAETASPAMKRLVRKRAEIFEAQRGAREHPLQKSSQERVESSFAQHLATQGPYLSGFRNYVAFCDRCHIPPFPLTYTIMALWLYDKCSLSDGYFHTYKHGLLLAADVVLASWKSERVYKRVSRFDSGGLALSEFFEERRLMYQKAPTKGASPKKAPQQRKLPKRPPSKGSDSSSAETYGSEKEESNYTDSEEEGDRSGELTSSCNVPVPGLPKSTDVFATEIDLYKAYVAALVPVYGVSVILATTSPSAATIKCNRSHQHYASSPGGMCSWTCVARREDSGWRIDAAASNFSHTHGPCKEILMDPNWRPKVHNPHAREALGMPPLRAAKKKPTRWTARQSTVSSDEEPLQKKPRLSVQPAALPSTTGSHALANPAPPYSMQRGPVSSYMPSHNASRFPLRPSPAAAAPISSAPPVQPPAARLPMPPPALRPPPILQARLLDDPEQLVAAFCAGLHPSLDALAKPLVSIGIDSIEALVPLRLMDPRNLSRLLDAMRQRWTARRASDPSLPPLSLVHLNLFAKFVKA